MTDSDDTPTVVVLLDAHLLLRPPVDDDWAPPHGIRRPLHLVERQDQ